MGLYDNLRDTQETNEAIQEELEFRKEFRKKNENI